MDAVRRQRYLKAMGIDVWVHKGANSEMESGITAGEARETPSIGTPLLLRTAVESKFAIAPEVPQEKIVSEPVAFESAPPREVPKDWKGLRDAVRNCKACSLCKTRTQTVFGVGPEDARLMVIGEGPGADEDASGEPFVGRAGKLLDLMLASIGRSRQDNVFIANVVKCRPPGNRDPQAAEVEACRPYLEQQIELIQPDLIVALGRVAAQRLLASDQPLSKLRATTHTYGARRTPLLITYHPAYLLRSPREKAKSWMDLKQVSRMLAATKK